LMMDGKDITEVKLKNLSKNKTPNSTMNVFLIKLIKLYQRNISPSFGARCLYTPTCSQYSIEMLEKEPVWRVAPSILTRFLSCNPVNGYLRYKKSKA